MKRYLYLILVLLSCAQVFAQPEYSRFSIKPNFALGMNIPGKQTVNSGREWMTYQWKIVSVGNLVDSQGNEIFNFSSTNRMGIDFGYKIKPNIEVLFGASRMSLISDYNSSFTFQFQGQNFGGFNDKFLYYEGNLGFKYQASSLYYTASLRYIPDIFANSNKKSKRNSGVDSGDFTTNGTGLKFSSHILNDNKFNFYFGIGQEMYLMDNTIDVELGFNLSPKTLYQENITFLENNNIIGENIINRSSNALFVSFRKTLNFNKKVKTKTPKPQKVKKEPEVKKLEEKHVELGENQLEIGEDLVLENIQFEQTKAVLDAVGMAELDRVFVMLNQFPAARIAISGHTSQEGSRAQNIELSKLRAEACKAYLVKKGIKSNRINAYGLGPDRPISSTNQEMNRRVELKLISL